MKFLETPYKRFFAEKDVFLSILGINALEDFIIFNRCIHRKYIGNNNRIKINHFKNRLFLSINEKDSFSSDNLEGVLLHINISNGTSGSINKDFILYIDNNICEIDNRYIDKNIISLSYNKDTNLLDYDTRDGYVNVEFFAYYLPFEYEADIYNIKEDVSIIMDRENNKIGIDNDPSIKTKIEILEMEGLDNPLIIDSNVTTNNKTTKYNYKGEFKPYNFSIADINKKSVLLSEFILELNGYIILNFENHFKCTLKIEKDNLLNVVDVYYSDNMIDALEYNVSEIVDNIYLINDKSNLYLNINIQNSKVLDILKTLYIDFSNLNKYLNVSICDFIDSEDRILIIKNFTSELTNTDKFKNRFIKLEQTNKIYPIFNTNKEFEAKVSLCRFDKPMISFDIKSNGFGDCLIYNMFYQDFSNIYETLKLNNSNLVEGFIFKNK